LIKSAEVKNTGPRAGETVAQLYMRLDGTSIALPLRMLKGFSANHAGSGRIAQSDF
jgi:hypothetical protein